jgi:hypothetical protein
MLPIHCERAAEFRIFNSKPIDLLQLDIWHKPADVQCGIDASAVVSVVNIGLFCVNLEIIFWP